MHLVVPYVVAAVLFGIGVYGVVARRNAVLVLMAVELMLNAVNVLLITADLTADQARRTGGSFALFVIVLAAAEIGVALAVILQLYRTRQTVAVDEIDVLDDEVDS
jgi:NADH-quinone oxidoreductase subunit K